MSLIETLQRIEHIQGMAIPHQVSPAPSAAPLQISSGRSFSSALNQVSATQASEAPRLSSPKASGSPAPAAIEQLIQDKARKYDLEPNLLRSLVRAESNFNPKAVSPAGAQGLGQLMPGTARSLGVQDPTDPEQNLEGTAKYLRQQLDRFGKVELALAAYNAGPGAVQKYGGIPPYSETQAYVKKIMSWVRG